MTDALGFDGDIDHAWRAFERDVANYVAAIRDNDVLILESRYDSADGTSKSADSTSNFADDTSNSADSTSESSACVQFFGWGHDLVRCEVPSNDFLNPLRKLNDEQHAELRALGWKKPSEAQPDMPGSASFYRDANRAWSDQLAHNVVRVFREIWQIPHPSFLKATVSGRYDTPEFRQAGDRVDDGPRAVQPTGPSNLTDLMNAALTPYFGTPPPRDADGDITIEFDNGRSVYLRVLESEPYIEIIAVIAQSVSRRADAAEVLLELNQKSSDVKFVLIRNRILAVVRVNASPFVPDHLLAGLASLRELLDTVHITLAQRLGGTGSDPTTIVDRGLLLASDEPIEQEQEHERVQEHECEGDTLPAGLLSLVGLHTTGPEILDPVATTAKCNHDRATVIDYLKQSLEQEIFWRRASLEEATLDEIHLNQAEQDMCDAEGLAWSRTVMALRGALTYLETKSQLDRVHGHQLELFEASAEATLFDDIAD